MNLYERYCRETFDEAGRLTKVSLRWPAEFNFAYDVADEMARQAMRAETIKYSVIVVSSIPMLIMYPFVQRFFVKGVMIGAIKG